MIGSIQKLVRERCLGLIRSADGEALFFQASAVLGSEFASLVVGQAVGFDLEHDERGTKATNVRVRAGQALS